jgi:hypothetical protein
MPGKYFYPRPPRGGRRRSANARTNPSDFYPRPPRGGRPRSWTETKYVPTISIHALREEGDPWKNNLRIGTKISIHALREEGDILMGGECVKADNFYPRPPRGGRPEHGPLGHGVPQISIHALREEGDGSTPQRFITGGKFLSTPSARRATCRLCRCPCCCCHFYPRPPRGGRQQKQRQNLYFQTNYTTFCTNLEEP